MLYHISEEPGIIEFIPRKPEFELWKNLPPVVWAIDDEHLFYYYFPRDCPRIIYHFSEDIHEDDKIKYFSNTTSKIIITIENRWFKKMTDTTIYKYIFGEQDFTLLDNTPGNYISEKTIKPKGIEKINNLIDLLLGLDIELRLTPNIFPLRNSLIKSTIKKFSIIRFRNAIQ